MKQIRRIIVSALVIFLGLSSGASYIYANDQLPQTAEKKDTIISLSDGTPYWSTFGGNATGTGTISGKTVTNLDNLQAKSTIIPNQFFEPILVGNYLYNITDCKFLTKYDANGKELLRTPLGAELTTWISARMAYGDGKIFVEVNGRIKAYDATTLQPLWQSIDTKLQINGAIVYHNGYIYAGATNGNGADGYFFALSTKDENTASENEEKSFTWKTNNNKGYYWSSGVITGNAIVFAGDDGVLVSHHLTQDITFDTYDMGSTANVRSNLVYLDDRNAVLIGTQASKQLLQMPMNSDGTFQRSALRTLQLDSEVSGGIAYYRGRAYVSSGAYTGKALQVVDVNTMKVAYATSVNTQSYPLITTAYAAPENNYKVYVYVIDYKGGLVMLEDQQGQTEEIKQLKQEGYLSFNSNSIVGDINGNLYIYNGYNSSTGNRITIYENPDHAYTAEDVDRNIKRLQADGVTYKNTNELTYLQLQFEALSEPQQSKVTQRAVYDQLQKQKVTVVETAINHIQQRIAAIPDVIGTGDIAMLETLWNDFGQLTDLDQTRVNNANLLKEAVSQMYQIAANVEQLINDINAIDVTSITLADQVMITRLQSSYQKLSPEDQAKITNIHILNAAIDRIKELQDEQLLPDVIKKIEALPNVHDVTLDQEETIKQVYNTYQTLHKNIQALVTNVEKLNSVYTEVVKQRNDVDSLNQTIWTTLDPKNITLADEKNVNDYMKRYAALSTVNQRYIRYYDDVKQANEIIQSLKKGIVPSIVFDNIINSDHTYTFQGEWNKENYTMSWKGNNIKKPMDMKLGFYSVSPYADAIHSKKPNAYILHMNQETTLPGLTTINVYVPANNGTYKLYRYDAKRDTISSYMDVVVKDHMVSYDVTEGGVYLIDIPVNELSVPKTETSKTPATGDTSQTALYMLSFTAGLITLHQMKKRKKTSK